MIHLIQKLMTWSIHTREPTHRYLYSAARSVTSSIDSVWCVWHGFGLPHFEEYEIFIFGLELCLIKHVFQVIHAIHTTDHTGDTAIGRYVEMADGNIDTARVSSWQASIDNIIQASPKERCIQYPIDYAVKVGVDPDPHVCTTLYCIVLYSSILYLKILTSYMK